MKIQRKLLTGEQREKICEQYEDKGCSYCPLRVDFDMGNGWASCDWVKEKEKQIAYYWNEEIEVEEK